MGNGDIWICLSIQTQKHVHWQPDTWIWHSFQNKTTLFTHAFRSTFISSKFDKLVIFIHIEDIEQFKSHQNVWVSRIRCKNKLKFSKKCVHRNICIQRKNITSILCTQWNTFAISLQFFEKNFNFLFIVDHFFYSHFINMNKILQ